MHPSIEPPMCYHDKILNQPESLMNYVDALIEAITPGRLDAALMTIGAGVGAVLNFMFGDKVFLPLSWLAVFVVLDFFTGIYAALRTHTFSSRIGFIGIPKKIFIFLMVALCHGLDVTCGVDWCAQLAIFAYCVNEFGSLIENIIRAGHGDFIPAFIHKLLAVLEGKVETKLKEKK